MSFRVLATLTRAALTDEAHTSVDFIWHGGETTVMPISFYRKAVYVQEQFRRPGQIIRNLIQTNGTRLTAEWARFLKTYGFTIGISLDGPPELHDRQRRYLSGRGSFDTVRRGIDLLRAHDIPFMVLMVVDEDALALGPDRIFDTFVALGVKDYSLMNAKPASQPDAPSGTPTDHYVDPGRMGRFLAAVYDCWRAHGDESINIRELRSIENRIRGGRPGICTLAGGCLGHYYLIEPTGEVAHCDLFLGDPNYSFGNVLTRSFAEMRAGRRMRSLQLDNEQQLTGMRDCPEFAVCNGWCPHERYTAVRHYAFYDGSCCGLRDLIDHVRSRQAEAPAPPVAGRS